ncbi:MAG: hypothetical protein QJR02_08230 [Sinobacteraceae bacterium]|nr:hypothetical protein [Nevskiaceae bacterium]
MTPSLLTWAAMLSVLAAVDVLAWAGVIPIETLTVTLWRAQRAHAWLGFVLLCSLMALTVHVVSLPSPLEGHP